MTRERRRARSTTGPSKRPRNQRPVRSSVRREALILAAIGIPILAAAAVSAVVLGGRPTASPATSALPTQGSSAPGAGQRDSLVYADSPTLGPVDAPVTLVEFLDPECEACRAAYPFVKSLMADYDARIRLVIRYVPGHNNSALAIAAIEEAGEQGRYWEALEYFFSRQSEWGEQQEPQTQAFLQYGAALGLDVEKLRAALASPDYSKVERDAADGQALGIRGTPTFFVNGKLVEDLSEQGLRAAIDQALAN